MQIENSENTFLRSEIDFPSVNTLEKLDTFKILNSTLSQYEKLSKDPYKASDLQITYPLRKAFNEFVRNVGTLLACSEYETIDLRHPIEYQNVENFSNFRTYKEQLWIYRFTGVDSGGFFDRLQRFKNVNPV